MPRIAAITAAVVVAVALVVFLTRPDDGGGSKAGGEVFLQAAGSSGPDPFTESTARESDPEPGTASPSAAPSSSATGSQVTRGVDGAAPGLYGGTRKVASCDVEKQIGTLRAAPDKNRAFASVQDIEPSAVPDYLRSLTPVQLRMDTRVTNHGFRDGEATAYQAVLQGGTAVLVDDRGVPRVRCACGNPLLPPVAQESTPKQTGKAWPGYRAQDVVVVDPASKPVDEFVMVDPENGDWFTRPAGDTGSGDRKTDPPEDKTKDESESPCPPGSDDASCPPGEVTPPRDDPPPRDGGTTPPNDGGTTPPTTTEPEPEVDTEPAPPETPPEPQPDSQPAPPPQEQPQEQQPGNQSAPQPQDGEPEPRNA